MARRRHGARPFTRGLSQSDRPLTAAAWRAAAAAGTIRAMNTRTALLVIDVQQSFTRRPYFSAARLDVFLREQNRLIEGAHTKGWQLVRVLHQTAGLVGTDPVDDPFAPASGLVRPLDGLSDFDADLTVHKTRHSALVGTGLDVWLVSQGVRRVVVSGIRTEQCCETTARHASDLGWAVDFVTDATMTWDIPQAGAPALSAADVRERTATVLRGRFARVLTVDGALADAGGPSS
jgi:nicotinamidase-related amidase